MSIRSNSRPIGADLSPELQGILRKNGMQAHIVTRGDALQLVVQCHDSPLLSYPITVNQLKSLTDWGSNHANKKAYNTFVNLVSKDFDIPRNFVHARNANGRVAMGLHGYRVGVGEYGRMGYDRGRWSRPLLGPMGIHMLGWTPRQQEGYHMRRVGGKLFMQHPPMMPERPDGRMKPGELQSGAYGFYYKGHQISQNNEQAVQQDVLKDLQAVITPIELRPRPQGAAISYKEAITSDVYFSNEKWQNVLATHGIVIDSEKKTLTIQSSATQQDLIYDLTDDEITNLTSNSIKEMPVQERIDLLNDVIKNDYDDKITMDMLNGKELISIRLYPEVEQEFKRQELQNIEYTTADQDYYVEEKVAKSFEDKHVAHVDGTTLNELNENKGWFREGKNGREVTVEDIKVEPVRDEFGGLEKDQKGDVKFRMTAVINGESISHEINQKQYEKFMAIDDYHRMKLFSRIFDEVDMKNIPGNKTGIGVQIGAALLAGLAVTRDIVRGHSGPCIFMERHEGPAHRPHVYFKPGVDSPRDLAARAFEAGLNAGEHGVGLGHGR